MAQVERDTDWIAKALVKYDIELWERDDNLRSWCGLFYLTFAAFAIVSFYPFLFFCSILLLVS